LPGSSAVPPPIVRLCISHPLPPDPADAADTTQEVVLKVFAV